LRIASYNVESLFDRPKAMNPLDWSEGRSVLDLHARINALFGESIYTDAIKDQILDILKQLGLDKADDGGKYAVLRQNRGRLLRRYAGEVTVIAHGRADWIGWVELITEPVNELATQHTAMVLRDVNADIQAVIEADSRIALRDFSAILLEQVAGSPFGHVMLIDGNDDRGIDVGLLTRSAYEIVKIRSHVDDASDSGPIFSRDCLQVNVQTPTGVIITLLVNHFKSKGYGSQTANNARRLLQASRVGEIYDEVVADGQPNVVILGDFNDTPDSDPLEPLLAERDLQDISAHPSFTSDGREGTYANGTKGTKIDYILLSPALFDRVTGGAIFRTGVWGGKNGTLWQHYPTMTKQVEQASDHAAIYADINI
jgi:endonuclease/exonuclease/phosphatase family metal-dependent hydrolase